MDPSWGRTEVVVLEGGYNIQVTNSNIYSYEDIFGSLSLARKHPFWAFILFINGVFYAAFFVIGVIFNVYRSSSIENRARVTGNKELAQMK
jgi:hypothetical protein